MHFSWNPTQNAWCASFPGKATSKCRRLADGYSGLRGTKKKTKKFFVFLEYILTAMSRSNEILFALKIYSWAMFWIPTSWGLLFKKKFSGTLKIYKIMKKRGSSPVWCSLQQLKIAIWTNLNQQKPDTAHVSDNKNRNTRRMIIIFVSVDRVGPKDIC